MWQTANSLVQRLQDQRSQRQQQQQQQGLAAGELAGVPALLAALHQWHQQGGTAAMLPLGVTDLQGDVMYYCACYVSCRFAHC